MSGGRGGNVPPHVPGARWKLRWGKAKCEKQWAELRNSGFATKLDWLARQLQQEPRWAGSQSRHHQLKGTLAAQEYGGETCERWQHEISGGGRVWFVIHDATQTVYIVLVSAGAPSRTH